MLIAFRNGPWSGQSRESKLSDPRAVAAEQAAMLPPSPPFVGPVTGATVLDLTQSKAWELRVVGDPTDVNNWSIEGVREVAA